MADMGSGIVWQSSLFAPNTTLPMPNGVFYGNSATRFAEITDGLSNTGFYSERIVGDGTTGIISPIADVFFDPGAPLTPDDAMAQCQALNIYDPANQTPDDHGSPLDRRPAHHPPRHAAEHALVRVLHRQPGGHAAEQQASRRGQPASSATARSGSSRTRSTCKPGVRLGTRNGGEVISSDSFLNRASSEHEVQHDREP